MARESSTPLRLPDVAACSFLGNRQFLLPARTTSSTTRWHAECEVNRAIHNFILSKGASPSLFEPDCVWHVHVLETKCFSCNYSFCISPEFHSCGSFANLDKRSGRRDDRERSDHPM